MSPAWPTRWRPRRTDASPRHEDTGTPRPVLSAGSAWAAADLRIGRHLAGDDGRDAARPRRHLGPRRLEGSPEVPPQDRPRPADDAFRPTAPGPGLVHPAGGTIVATPMGVVPAESVAAPAGGRALLPLESATALAVLELGDRSGA